MEITLPGTILIPLGLLLFVFSSKSLYYFTIISIPFTATSLINSSGGAPLIASHFFIFLSTLKILLTFRHFPAGKLISNKGVDKSLKYLFLFFFIATLSNLMPLWIDGNLTVFHPFLNAKLVKFSMANIRNFIPFALGIFLTYIVVINNKNFLLIKNTLKLYIISVSFVSLWGLLEYLCYYLNITYPEYIFNTAVHESVMVKLADLENVSFYMTRLSSTTLEPSHFSQIILTVIPIFTFAFIINKEIFSKIFDLLFFLLNISVLLLSTSTTAYAGLLIILLLSSTFSNIIKKPRFKYYALLFFGFGLLLFLYNININEYLNQILIFKSYTASGIGRLFTTVTAWSYFLEYPIFGIGWGIATSDDLIVLLLVHSGLMGLLSFSIMIYYVVSKSISSLKVLCQNKLGSNNINILFRAGTIVSFISLIIVSAVSGFLWYTTHFYFLLGVLISLNRDFLKSSNVQSKIIS